MVEAVIRMRRYLPLLLCLLPLSHNAFAHRLDECLQAAIVDLEPGAIRLNLQLTPGVAVAEQVLDVLDRNHDGVVSTNEVAAYAELLKRDVSVRLDERFLELNLVSSDCSRPAELRTGFGLIQLEFSMAPGSLAKGPHRLTLENRHLPAISVYLFNAAQPGAPAIQITGQKRNETQSLGEIGFIYHAPENSARATGMIISAAGLLLAAWAGMRRIRQIRGARPE